MEYFRNLHGLLSIFFFLAILILVAHRRINLSLVKLVAFFWVFYLLLYKASESEFLPVSEGFDIRVITFFLCFFGFYTLAISCKFKFNFRVKKFIPSYFLFFVVTINVIYTLSLFIHVIYLTGDFIHYRDYLLESGESIRVGTSFPLVAALLVYARANRVYNVKMISALLLLLAIISSSKIFIMLALIFVIPWYEQSFNASFFKICMILIFSFLGFILLHLLLGKYVGSSNVFYALVFTLKGYLLGGIAVFQDVLNGNITLPDGFYIFSFLEKIPLLEFNYVAEIDNNGWFRTGLWFGNVYSAFSYWEELGGLPAFPIVGSIIGLLYGFIHKSNRYEFIVLKNFSYYPLIMMVFAEQFLLGLGMWVSFSLTSIFLCFIKNKPEV